MKHPKKWEDIKLAAVNHLVLDAFPLCMSTFGMGKRSLASSTSPTSGTVMRLGKTR